MRGGGVEDGAHAPDDRVGRRDDEGRVDEMVEESFPASDPPTGWAGEDPRDLLDGTGASAGAGPTAPPPGSDGS